MSFRLGALLCLSGLAACSHDTPRTADNQNDVNDVSARSETAAEPGMTPASLEPSSAHNDGPSPRTDPKPASDNASAAREGGSSMATEPSKPEPSKTTEPSKTDPAKTTAANPNTAPDNTKINERDRNAAALTPFDQGENEKDRKITQQIRQAVMADGSLSFTAKNVKIITINGKVTLRGPVNSAQERSAIEAAARKVAGATQIDNQLEVKK